MPVELPEKFPFSVDTWSLVSKRKPYHFLTHAHSDHIAGIERHAIFPIYCSWITMKLVLHRHAHLHKSLFIVMSIEEPMFIAGDEPFTVTAFDANHCAGAVMLLFEGRFGNVLHTGDCRLSMDCLLQLPRKYLLNAQGSAISALDYIFLDCTFAKENVLMPDKKNAIQQVLNCIRAHPKAPIVYLACSMLGHEELLQAVSSSFGVKIYVVKKDLPDYYADMKTVAPELITTIAESTKFQICEGFPKLYEKARQSFAEACARSREQVLFVRPSTQWYTYKERLEGAGSGIPMEEVPKKMVYAARSQCVITPTKAQKDQFGIWHVCYSMHSSRDELQMALRMLCFKNVVSTTDCSISYLISRGMGRGSQENQGKRIKVTCQGVERSITNEMSTISSDQSGQSKLVLTVTSSPSGGNNIKPDGSGKVTVCAKSLQTDTPRLLCGELPEGVSKVGLQLESKSLSTAHVTFLDKSVPLFGAARLWLSDPPPLQSIYNQDHSIRKERELLNFGNRSVMNEANNIARSSATTVFSNVNCSSMFQEDELKLDHGSTAMVTSSRKDGEESLTEQHGKQSGRQMICMGENASANLRAEPVPGTVRESTRNVYRMLCVSVPCHLPSLLDIMRNNAS